MVERFYGPLIGFEMLPGNRGDWVRYIDHAAEISALKKQVEELTAERDAATISGWKAAIDCVSYAAANTYGPRVDPAAVAKARDDLVQELLTASPGDYLDCCWKDAQDAIRAEAEAAALRKALKPFVALADKRDAHYRRRGGNCDNFPDTHPSYDIDAGKRELPMGVWRAARAALASTRETSDAG